MDPGDLHLLQSKPLLARLIMGVGDGKIMPKLPPADPWDRRIGVQSVADFKVDCDWIPVNENWAIVRPTITLHDDIYSLCKDAEVFIPKQQVDPAIVALNLSLAWTKRAVGSGGVPVTGMYERNPGHLMEPAADGRLTFRWWARVGSRLSVAVVRMDGNLAGQVRLVLVE